MVAMIKTFKVRGLVRVQNVWIKNLHCTRILANGSAETPFFFGKSRKGTGFNSSGISMAGSDSCVPLLGTRQ